MSGDVQPRKRKDRKKKREDDDLKESHHGVHATKLGTDDVLLHVQTEHSTGGHWCAKILFFSLLAILIGLIGLIIMENRGLSDLDTPLSESRYSEYFEGWVDEHRQAHDDHDKVTANLENHNAEPFEEEEDHSEQDIDDDDDHDDEHDHGDDDNDDENNVQENDDEDNNKEDDEDDHEEKVDEDDDNKNNNNNDDDDDDVETQENEQIYLSNRHSIVKDNEKNEQDNDDETDEGIGDEIDDDNNDQTNDKDTESNIDSDKFDFTNENDPFDEVDEDNNDDSAEEIVENDAEELLHLERKAKEQEENDNKQNEPENEQEHSSSQIKSKTRSGEQNNNDDVDDLINEQMRMAESERIQNNLKSSLKIYDSILLKYPNNFGALYGKAKILDRLSEKYQSNNLLNDAIEAYKHFLSIADTVKSTTTNTFNNMTFKEAAERCIDRMRFRGLHLQAIPIHEKLIRRFDNDPHYRNQLAVTYLLINRLSDAKYVLHDTLLRWRDNGFAQVHYGFVIKNLDKDLERAVKYLKEGIQSKDNGTQDGRFYFHLGDALQRLGRMNEAKEIYRQGAKINLFPSEYQRSLYNVNGLKAKPFWIEYETKYENFFEIFKQNWHKIRDEGLNILNENGLFIDEAENLKDIGDWKQFELFARGFKNTKNCQKAPITCKLIETFPAARYCKRGQTKFSVLHPNTHVWPHCGPTNCRLRAHLGLKIPPGTKIRVADQERTWKEGQFLIFDDSFEHEVWHNGTSFRLVLIIDVWHPELTNEQKNNLSPI